MNDSLAFQMMYSNVALSSRAWISIALLVALICPAVFRPERIAKYSLFRAACVFYVLHLVAPALGEFIIQMTALEAPGGRISGTAREYVTLSAINRSFDSVFIFATAACYFGSLRLYAPKPPKVVDESSMNDDPRD